MAWVRSSVKSARRWNELHGPEVYKAPMVRIRLLYAQQAWTNCRMYGVGCVQASSYGAGERAAGIHSV